MSRMYGPYRIVGQPPHIAVEDIRDGTYEPRRFDSYDQARDYIHRLRTSDDPYRRGDFNTKPPVF